MRIFRISALMLFGAITLLFLYANLRKVSPTERLEPVSIVIFELNGDLSTSNAQLLEQKLNETNGVTACRVNHKANVASVVYHSKQLSLRSLKDRFASAENLTASLKTFEPVSGGCPVHHLSNSFTRFISTLDLRQPI